MKRESYLGTWKSPQAEAKFRAMEDELWREAFPTARPDAVDVPTSVGPTHVYHWPGTGVPIVFLHGMGGTGLQWYSYVGALEGRDLYAIDNMGDVGRSVQQVAFRDAAHITAWLDEALAGLGIAAAHLVGSSYGGWLALNLAIRAPNRVASLTLLDPVGLGPLDLRRFLSWGACVFGGSLLPAAARRRVAVWTRMPALEDKRQIRMVFYGQRNHRFRAPPTEIDDESLRTISAPAIVLLGEKSEIHRAARVAEHVRACMPGARVEIVAGAGHALPISHTELACARIKTLVDAADPRVR